MNWKVALTGPARKALVLLQAKDHKLVAQALKEMEREPHSGDVLKLEGQRFGFRRRVGNWRLFFDVYPERRLIVVTGIVRRTTTTYRKR